MELWITSKLVRWLLFFEVVYTIYFCGLFLIKLSDRKPSNENELFNIFEECVRVFVTRYSCNIRNKKN